eukprot:scaffold370_cov349-Pavlova_lutheri.AAC.28
MALTDSRCANRVVTGAALGASLGGAVGKSRGKRTVEATRSRGETVSSAFPPPLVPAETKDHSCNAVGHKVINTLVTRSRYRLHGCLQSSNYVPIKSGIQRRGSEPCFKTFIKVAFHSKYPAMVTRAMSASPPIPITRTRVPSMLAPSCFFSKRMDPWDVPSEEAWTRRMTTS